MRMPLPLMSILALLALLAEPSVAASSRPYDVQFSARFVPAQGYAEASIEVAQADGLLTLLDFNAPGSRFSRFDGDGDVSRDGQRLIWQVPAAGGRLQYRVAVDHKRRGGAHDARLTEAWAVMRLDNLFPAARAVAAPGAHSRSILHLQGPAGWSFETPYGRSNEPVEVEPRGRRFTRPVGWMAAGDLGIRRSVIAGREFAIAGPRGENFRRMDMLAFLHWTVPELVRVAPFLPDRVLIVGGSDDMWRGGLSGPASLYLHPGRPLISGNSTSTLLHELMHVAMRGLGEAGDNWIVEGIPEYYSLIILLRSGGISGDRFEGAFTWLKDWTEREDGRLAHPSTGANTAYAVLLFRDLDVELAAAGRRLDSVVRELFGAGPVNRHRLAELMEAELGQPSRVLERALEAAPAAP
jgi:hypothetical protein